MAKKPRKVWRANPLCLFWTVWKIRNRIAFDGKEFSIQSLKCIFVGLPWLRTKLFINDVPLTLHFFSIGWELVEGDVV